MTKLFRLLFVATLVAVSSVSIVPQASALVGGPFGEDSAISTNGNYRGSLYGKNTVGFFFFTSDTSTALASNVGAGFCAVFSEGVAYIGQCYGFVDVGSRTTTGVLTSVNATPSSIGGVSNYMSGGFMAKIKTNRGFSLQFEGEGEIVTALNGTVPIFEDVENGFIVSRVGDPIPPVTEINVIGLRVSRTSDRSLVGSE